MGGNLADREKILAMYKEKKWKKLFIDTGDFFINSTDQKDFRNSFERSMDRACIYIAGKCKEELICCILNKIRRLKVIRGVLVVKNRKDWEDLRCASQEMSQIKDKILIPWFQSNEIVAIQGNTNIFVYGEDDDCAGKEPLKMRKRTRRTIIKQLENTGISASKAYELVEDTHGFYIPSTTVGIKLFVYYSESQYDADLFEKMLTIQPKGKIAVDYAPCAYRREPALLEDIVNTAKEMNK